MGKKYDAADSLAARESDTQQKWWGKCRKNAELSFEWIRTTGAFGKGGLMFYQ